MLNEKNDPVCQMFASRLPLNVGQNLSACQRESRITVAEHTLYKFLRHQGHGEALLSAPAVMGMFYFDFGHRMFKLKTMSAVVEAMKTRDFPLRSVQVAPGFVLLPGKPMVTR